MKPDVIRVSSLYHGQEQTQMADKYAYRSARKMPNSEPGSTSKRKLMTSEYMSIASTSLLLDQMLFLVRLA